MQIKSRKACATGLFEGIALIATLLLLMLVVAMTLAMTIAVTSDTLITRYYRNFRSSFYAADSGANIARTYMLNQLYSTLSTSLAAGHRDYDASSHTCECGFGACQHAYRPMAAQLRSWVGKEQAPGRASSMSFQASPARRGRPCLRITHARLYSSIRGAEL